MIKIWRSDGRKYIIFIINKCLTIQALIVNDEYSSVESQLKIVIARKINILWSILTRHSKLQKLIAKNRFFHFFILYQLFIIELGARLVIWMYLLLLLFSYLVIVINCWNFVLILKNILFMIYFHLQWLILIAQVV